MTASLTVCQSRPNSPSDFSHSSATPAHLEDDPPSRPIRQHQTGRCDPRFGDGHDPCGHSESGQINRCLCHTSRLGRPKAGRSTSSTRERSFTHTGPPHPGQPGRVPRTSTWTRIGPPSSPSTLKTFTSGKPTSISHTRIVFVSTGVLQTGRRCNRQTGRTLASSRGPYTPLISEEPL